MNLSDKIRIIRKARGLSQEILGENLSRVSKNGISRQAVSDWENGRYEPMLENIRDLANVLNVSFDALLDDSMDLNDKDTLNAVLNNAARQQTQHEGEESAPSSLPSYQIFEWDKSRSRAVKIMIAFLVLVVVTIFVDIQVDYFGVRIFIELAPEPQSFVDNIVVGLVAVSTFIIFVLLNAFSVVLFICEIIVLAHIVKKSNFPILIGELSNEFFTLYGNKNDGAVLYTPISEIEKIELHGKQKKHYGNIAITVVGDTKPIIVRNVTYPKKFIEFFTKSTNG